MSVILSRKVLMLLKNLILIEAVNMKVEIAENENESNFGILSKCCNKILIIPRIVSLLFKTNYITFLCNHKYSVLKFCLISIMEVCSVPTRLSAYFECAETLFKMWNCKTLLFEVLYY